MKRLMAVWLAVCAAVCCLVFPTLSRAAEPHNFIGGRDCGNVGMLRGNVHLICVFVNDSNSYWSDAEVDEIYRGLWKDAAYLEKTAAGYGIRLKITSGCDRLTVPPDQEDRWLDYLLETRYCSPEHDLKWVESYFEQSMGYDECPFLFFFNREGTCYAYMATLPTYGHAVEYAVYYPSTMTEDRSIAHELYHIFGASDYYYPEETERIAKQYFPDSAMLISGREMDDLTAYLIGWADELTPKAYRFLQELGKLP